MSTWKYIGDSPRTFPDHGLEVEPGQTIDADDNPDPQFFEAVTTKKSSSK